MERQGISLSICAECLDNLHTQHPRRPDVSQIRPAAVRGSPTRCVRINPFNLHDSGIPNRRLNM